MARKRAVKKAGKKKPARKTGRTKAARKAVRRKAPARRSAAKRKPKVSQKDGLLTAILRRGDMGD